MSSSWKVWDCYGIAALLLYKYPATISHFLTDTHTPNNSIILLHLQTNWNMRSESLLIIQTSPLIILLSVWRVWFSLVFYQGWTALASWDCRCHHLHKLTVSTIIGGRTLSTLCYRQVN